MLIYKENLIEDLKEWEKRLGSSPAEEAAIVMIKAFIDKVMIQPVVDVTDTNVGSKWIPCSERLPEEHQTVITTHEDGTVVFHRYIKEHGFIYNWETDMELRKKRGKVVAWMPLPEPWKGKV